MPKISRFLQITAWMVATFISAYWFLEETFLNRSPSLEQQAIFGGLFVLLLFYGALIFAEIFLGLALRKHPPLDDD